MSTPLSVLEAAGVPAGHWNEVWVHGRSVLTLSVRGPDALAAWRLLAAAHGETGRWPVLTGRAPFAPDKEDGNGEEVAAGDARDLLAGWLDGELEDGAEEHVGPVPRTPEEAEGWAPAVPELRLPATLEAGVTGIRAPGRGPVLPRVFLAAVAAEQPWEAPARLGFGGHNGCPPAAHHLSVLRRWNGRHGLRALTVTDSVLEFEVARPPRTAAQALLLAAEQFAYCPDLVYQGCESVLELAGTLLGNPVWYFWWD